MGAEVDQGLGALMLMTDIEISTVHAKGRMSFSRLLEFSCVSDLPNRFFFLLFRRKFPKIEILLNSSLS